MRESILRPLEDYSAWLTALLFLVLVLSLQTLGVLWETGRRQARGTMLFGARVSPEFLVSPEAVSIRRTFRRRIWLLTSAVVLGFVLLAGPNAPDPERWLPLMLLASVTGNSMVFALAHGQTKRRAVILTAPPTRTAVLSVAQDESSAWLTALEWLGIVLPIGIPCASAALIALRWQGSPEGRMPLDALRQVSAFGLFGVFPAATCYWLRFDARSSDWASDPLISRRYRAVLGSMVSSVFTFIILDSCLQSVMPLLEPASWQDQDTYFACSIAGFVCVGLGVLAMRMYLARHLSRESVDPMPDRCWKWGYFYFNQADPAMVVPLRSGTGFSFNHSRRQLWIVLAAVTAGLLLAVFSSSVSIRELY
jgi:hypothetical protein